MSPPSPKATRSSNAIALTMGDPAGVGLDITLQAWSQRDERNLPPFALYADPNAVSQRAGALGLEVPLTRIASPVLAVKLFHESLPVVDVPLAQQVHAGSPDTQNSPAVISAIDQAVTDTMEGLANAVVTNPISKAALYDAGFQHPGHTEYLAHLARRFVSGEKATPVMMLVSDELRVIPLTIHVPLRDVPGAISTKLIIETAKIAEHALRYDYAIAEPRLAITGLNPHAGENGAIGKEEDAIIAPAIADLKNQGLAVTGPHPADTLFHAAARQTYDAAIAMYHDQALIPIKTLAFDKGVNATLGLPFVRTSPDHGTAFDIAGTGEASPESLIAALKLASMVAQQRSCMQTQADA